MSILKIPKLKYLNSNNFVLIAGPCVIEDESLSLEIASKICAIADKLEIPFVFKGSFKKANRSKIDSFTGIGDIKSLSILKNIGSTFNIPTITDVHETKDAQIVAEYVDVIQIPAFLARQTDLLLSAAKTGKFINIKKGQFMSPESMKFAVEKVTSTGNNNFMVTDRGTQFGYKDLVVDLRSIPILKKIGPTILDVTHSLQKPNQNTGVSGGSPNLIETIARAGVVNSVDGLFIETHPNPRESLSDGANMLQLNKLESLLDRLIKIRQLIKKF
tara:strand:+ start:20268 stop:21086 length:819 start_codon:yes stop_codon:yes gene_type:complete